MLDHWVTIMQVYTGSGLCVSWVLCFYNVGWTGKCNMLKFHSSFILLLLVFYIFTYLSLTCQGTYLTSTARSHAIYNNLHEGAVIGDFNGEFWGVYTLHQVIILFYTRLVKLLFLCLLIKKILIVQRWFFFKPLLQFIGNLITFALLSDGQVCGG